MLVATSTLAGAASSRASSARISAHLTKTSFKSSQTGQVKLKYSFSAKSRTFGYLLSFKTGTKWQTVKSSTKWGSFKGSHTMTVKKLFASTPVKVGSYRLKLSADRGSKRLSFRVVAAPGGGPTGSGTTGGGTTGGGTTGGGTTPTDRAPTNTAAPTISGTIRQGGTLTVANGNWDNSPTSYAYQWRRCDGVGATCSDIPTAISNSYILVLADAGSTIRVVVTASNSYGSASATSSQTAIVASLSPANTALPAISGTTTQGQVLSASNGSWNNSPTSYAYRWRRCDSSGANCADISGATSSTYTLVYADAGSTIRVIVTASNSYGSASATSSQTAIVSGLPPANTALPEISGTTTQGETLTTTDGTWDNAPTNFAYQWQRCDVNDFCSNIVGATSASYILVPADVDSTILVVVTASNAYGSSSPVTSEETDTVGGLPPSNTSLPIISGTTTQGQTLTTTDGTWDNAPTDFAYQWQRCDSDGSNCLDIPDANSNSYTLVDSDAGSTIRVVVTATNVYDSTDSTSAQTALVSGFAPASSSLPTISGIAMQGKTLTTTDGTWDNSPTDFAYQWQRCDVSDSCSDIVGATSASYVLAFADISYTIRVVVTATNPYGSTAATSSQYPETGAVIGPVPENTSLPTISGTTKQGQTLTASTGTWTNTPTSYAYQWRRCDAAGSNCTDIGTNSSSYTLVFADAEYTIRVVVTATNSYGSTAATSDQTALVSSTYAFSLVAATTTPTAGQADSLTITAVDDGGHTVTSYAGPYCVTFWGPASSPGGTAPSYPAQGSCSSGQSAVTFAAGVATVNITLYNATATVLNAAEPSTSRASTMNLTVGPATVNKLSLAAATTTPNAGAPDNLTITALDAYGNTATSYTGSHTLTFAGASTITNSPFTPNVTDSTGTATNFGSGAAITFTSGVASVSSSSNGAMTLYKAGATSITVAEGGNYASSAFAVTVKAVATTIKAGGFHTCALLSYGGVECWGYNNYGQLGNNSTSNSSTPVAVNIKATAISSGKYSTCAIVSGGAIYCWGYNYYGQLGNNSTTNSSVPVQVSGITNAIAITTAGNTSCALTSAGTVYCWGRNNYGQLGINSTTNSSVPVQVHGVNNSGYLTGITAISTGESHVCAVRSTGSVYCWGYNNYGQLGDNSTRTRKTPVQVRAASGNSYLTGATSVSGGRYHTCALLSAHTVYCWGYNNHGQLGNNSTRNASRPVRAGSIATATGVSAGEYHSCAVLTTGVVNCWGYNNYGQLGDNTTTQRTSPVAVSGISTATQISAGGANDGTNDREHSCALLSTGAVVCWGYNGYGELGNGTTTNSSIPVVVSLQ